MTKTEPKVLKSRGEPLVHIAKRDSVSIGKKIFIRAAAILCAMIQNNGTWHGKRILGQQAVRLLRTVPRFAEPFGRTYGWDCYSAYASCNGDLFSPKTICHTGFTGTGIVIDPELDCSVILLTNSVHPDEGRSTVRLRSVVSNAVAASITDR